MNERVDGARVEQNHHIPREEDEEMKEDRDRHGGTLAHILHAPAHFPTPSFIDLYFHQYVDVS